MQNPFRFGSVVSGEDFADRRRELAELGRELAGGQHVFLLSPRRYGKTSLILTLLGRLRAQGLLTAYVDVFRATTAAQLLELTVQTVLRGVESKPERVLRLAVDLLGKLRPQVGTDSRGKPTLSLEIGNSPRSILAVQEEVLALPEELAKKRKSRLVLVFDEFQEIQRFPGAGLEKAMRSHFQTHRHVS
ncbi:MAG: putative prokaryotic ATPase, partial [candidate division NC10 bacterium]|nr:putative prokaryotic ATPase [candidate division NC10 bacterium]